MPALIVSMIIILIICGFIYWAYQKLMPLAPIASPFKEVIDVLVVILIAAIILFYVIIPLLQQLAHISIPGVH